MCGLYEAFTLSTSLKRSLETVSVSVQNLLSLKLAAGGKQLREGEKNQNQNLNQNVQFSAAYS